MRLPLPVATAFVLSALVLTSCSRPAATPQTTGAAAPAPKPAGSESTTAATPPPTASFKFATQTLTVPAGFTVELVAGPPLVNRPISIAFDEKGRLYATDSSGFSERADKQIAEKPHRIVRLEDRDGDGRFEHSTVFAEKMMFPQGALFRDGSLYVAAPPHIWKLTDTNDDGVSDRREIWYDGKTLTGCANDLHGPYLGPDGWMYWTKGAFAEQQHTLPNGKPLVTRAAHIFRSRLDGKGEEPVLTGGMDNPVGVTFTAAGERILCGTFFQVGTPGKRDGLIHAIYGGVYGKDQPAIAGHTRTGDLMPIMTHMGAAAPCGITTYRSRVFGADYHDNLFVCYFNLRKISRHELVADGATFRTRDTDFVTSDAQDFHPTDVLEDADGSLLVVDTGGWYKICCPTSALAKPDVLGGIYRIRKTGAPAPRDPRGMEIAWRSLGAAGLVALLSDERPYVRDRTIERLAALGAAAVPALVDPGVKPRGLPAQQTALWALARIDAPAARTAIRTALGSRIPEEVHVALQAVSLWRDAEAAPALRSILAGPNLAVARLAVEALGRIGDASAIEPIFAATKLLRGDAFTVTGTPQDPAERIFEHALVYALMEIGRPEPIVAQLKSSRDPRVLRVAMLALNQMPDSGLKAADIIAWLESADLRLKQTAGWIVGFHPEWGDALSDFFRRRLAAKAISADEQAGLEAQLAQLAASTAIQDLLATTVKNRAAEPASRRLALRAMAAARLRQTPTRWLSDLAALLSSDRGSPEIVRDAVATARGLPLPKGGSAELAAALARTGRDASLPADVRLDALAATTPAALGALEPELFQFARAHLDPEQPMLVRGAAATVLGKAPLSPDQQITLADTLKHVGALDLPKVLPAFERKPNEALGRRLVAAMRASPALSGVRAGTVKSLFARYPQPVQHDAEELVRMIDADAARQNARVDELLAQGPGDVRRGQLVFNSSKAACTLCHMMGHLGGRLGPDLTRIGQIRSERELLEATVFPSATFVRGFEPFTITTKAGAKHSGIIKKDTPEEVVLATGVDTEQRVARGDIREMKPAPTSPMPPGMDVVLTPQELADLVAFLKSRQ